jgi:hypothetical protein
VSEGGSQSVRCQRDRIERGRIVLELPCSGGEVCTSGGSDSTEFGRWGHVCCAAGSVCT